MKSQDWLNVAACADRRVLAKSFNFDCDDDSLIGDLQTRETAKWMAYRCAIVNNIYEDLTREIARAFDRPDLLDEIDTKSVTGVTINLITD